MSGPPSGPPAATPAAAPAASDSPAASAPTAASLSAATAHLEAPIAVVDLDAFDANARYLAARANGVPIRIATKSLRVRELIRRGLAAEGFAGLMCYSLAEALWWARDGQADIMVAYPSVDIEGIRALAEDADLAARVTITIDNRAHVEFVERALREVVTPAQIKVCIDVDASYRIGPVHIGVRRSPLFETDDVLAVVRAAQAAGMRVAGLMLYDAQIAGVADTSRAIRLMKGRANAQLRSRRAEIVPAVRAIADLEFVNGGGTGSLELTGSDPHLTEVAAGSGFFVPTLFDHYDAFEPHPAAFFALPMVRKPDQGFLTTFSGGYIASGPAGKDRVPQPLASQGLELIGSEGCGEVQTPLRGRRADAYRLGEKVWFRHAKAGELCEHFTDVHLIQGGSHTGSVPTYRGEGKSFG